MKYVDIILFTYLERGYVVHYSVSQIMTLLQTIVKLCHIRYDSGQKVKRLKTAVKVLLFVLVNQEGSH